MDELTELERLRGAQERIAAATTNIGTSVDGIRTRIQALLDQIRASDNIETIRTLADQASAEAGSLEAHAAALAPMANDPANPIPVPVPEPAPNPPSEQP
jgi:methyl-accepting chemotaxis protein